MRMIGFPTGCASCIRSGLEVVGQWLGTPLISRRRGESFLTRRWWFLARGVPFSEEDSGCHTAIVGTRKCTDEAQRVAFELGKALAQ
jgi:hypothetical protein